MKLKSNKSYYSNLTEKFKNDIKKTWKCYEQIIGKSKQNFYKYNKN